MFNKDNRKYLKQSKNFIFKCIRCSSTFIDSFHHKLEWKQHLCKFCTKDMKREAVQFYNKLKRTIGMCDLGGRTEPWELEHLPKCYGNAKDSTAGGLRTEVYSVGAWNHTFYHVPKSVPGAAQAATLPGFDFIALGVKK